jgi:hypothetical protein
MAPRGVRRAPEQIGSGRGGGHCYCGRIRSSSDSPGNRDATTAVTLSRCVEPARDDASPVVLHDIALDEQSVRYDRGE